MKPSQNLLSWQVFVATCRTRSISQAAVLLDIDLPKASRLLSALETELGEPLFDKSHRPIQPTPRAAELQRAVEPLVAGFQAALEPKAEPHERFTIDLSILHIGEEIRRGIVVPLLEGWTKTPWCMCLVNRREDELRSAKLRDFVLWMTSTAREDSARSANECRQIIEDAYLRSKRVDLKSGS